MTNNLCFFNKKIRILKETGTASLLWTLDWLISRSILFFCFSAFLLYLSIHNDLDKGAGVHLCVLHDWGSSSFQHKINSLLRVNFIHRKCICSFQIFERADILLCGWWGAAHSQPANNEYKKSLFRLSFHAQHESMSLSLESGRSIYFEKLTSH